MSTSEPPRRSLTGYETLIDKGLDKLFDKGVAVALLIGLGTFFGYDRLFMQPGRDLSQQEHERAMQEAWKATTEAIIARIESENERWRQAVLEAKFGKTDALRSMMKDG
jgi:hypothetical protein